MKAVQFTGHGWNRGTCWREIEGNTAIDEMVKECEGWGLGWVMPGRLDRVEMKAVNRT